MPARQARKEPTSAAPGLDEREVRVHDPMPDGYIFVPKGDVYITKNCRKKTHEADKTLFVVVDKKSKPVGLRCPTNIYNTVMSLGKATATKRAEAVLKRDTAIEENFEEAIVKLFPTIPKAEVQQVLKHSLKKHSRRVGRTNKVALQDRVKLAVRAHIRHVHTDYDKLLKQGLSRPVAREKIWDRLNEVARHWGGRPLKPAAAAPAKERRVKKGKAATPSSRGRRTKRNGVVKKAVVHAARVLTRRMSKEASELSPHGLRAAHSAPSESANVSIQVRTRQMAGEPRVPADEDVIIIDDDDDDEEQLAEDDNGFLEDVDMQDAIFASSEDTSDSDSDWSNWSDVGAGGSKGRPHKK